MYEGDRCEKILDFCEAKPCNAASTCISRLGWYECQCQHGYTGKNCMVNIDDCASYPCKNGESCIDKVNGYTCTCLPGNKCEMDTTSSQPLPGPERALRRLEFVAEYSIRCSLISNTVSQKTMETTATGHLYQKIKQLCQQDCHPASGLKAVITCVNDKVTVKWSTDVTFDWSVKTLPSDLQQQLTGRLSKESTTPILNLVVITNNPPIVYPMKTKNGAYAFPVLTTSCQHNKKYHQLLNKCL